MSHLQGYPDNLCLIENEIDIHTDFKTDIFQLWCQQWGQQLR